MEQTVRYLGKIIGFWALFSLAGWPAYQWELSGPHNEWFVLATACIGAVSLAWSLK